MTEDQLKARAMADKLNAQGMRVSPDQIKMMSGDEANIMIARIMTENVRTCFSCHALVDEKVDSCPDCGASRERMFPFDIKAGVGSKRVAAKEPAEKPTSGSTIWEIIKWLGMAFGSMALAAILVPINPLLSLCALFIVPVAILSAAFSFANIKKVLKWAAITIGSLIVAALLRQITDLLAIGIIAAVPVAIIVKVFFGRDRKGVEKLNLKD